MAIATQPWNVNTYSDPFDSKFDVKEYPIGGKLVQARLELSAMQAIQFTDDEMRRQIKHDMASELARFMIESNLIEFTRVDDPKTATMQIYARCYLAPDNQVKILRSLK
jgi:non-ribosomal peptide synthetase component E (peptide arylation enzyme)